MNDPLTNQFTIIVLNFLLHSTLLLSTGLFVSAMLQKKGAALQSAILRIALCFTLCSPLLSAGLMAMGVAGFSLALPDSGVEKESVALAAIEPLPEQIPVPIDNASEANIKPGKMDIPSISHPQKPISSASQHSGGLPISFITWMIPAFWILVVSILFLHFGIRYRAIGRLRRNAQPVHPETEERCRTIADELDIVCPQILSHPNVQSPFLMGVRRPAILFPQHGDHSEMPSREVVLHELAHLIRNDILWNYLCRISECLFFFQPLLWILNRQIGKVGDRVCDDYVVHYSSDRISYARQLTDLAERMQTPYSESVMGAGVISFRSSVGQRVQRILDRTRTVTLRIGRTTIAFILIIGFLSSTLAGLVGFQKSDNPNSKIQLSMNDTPQIEEEPSTPGELLPPITSQPINGGSIQQVNLMDCTISLLAVLAPNGADWTPAGEKFDWNEWIRANVEEPYQSKATEYQKRIDEWREESRKDIDANRGRYADYRFPIGFLFWIQYSGNNPKSIEIDNEKEKEIAIHLQSRYPQMISPNQQFYCIRGTLLSNLPTLDIKTIVLYGPYYKEKLYIPPETRDLVTVFMNRILMVSVHNQPEISSYRRPKIEYQLTIQSKNLPDNEPVVVINPIQSDPLLGFEVKAVHKDGTVRNCACVQTYHGIFAHTQPSVNESIDHFIYCGKRIRPVIWEKVDMQNAQKFREELKALPPQDTTPEIQTNTPIAQTQTIANESLYYLNYFQRYLGMLSREPNAKEKMKNFLAQVDWDKVVREFEQSGENYCLSSAIQDMKSNEVDLEHALLLAQKNVEKHPQEFICLNQYQVLLLQQQQFQEAQKVGMRILRIKPEDTTTLSNMAFAHYAMKEYDRAEALYKRILDKNPADTTALYMMIQNYKIKNKDPLPLIAEIQKRRGLDQVVVETDIAVP